MTRRSKCLLKTDFSPVSGAKTFSVFKDGVLVLMVDGDRLSVFKPEEVETISFPEIPNSWLVRVGDWVFTGCATLTKEQRKRIPKGCEIIQAI